MVFSSLPFIFYFLPIFLIVYLLLPFKYRNYWMLAASILFYSWGGPKFIFVILGSLSVNYFVVRLMHQSNNSVQRKYLLITSLLVNVGLLAYFKYANFFIENVNGLINALGASPITWSKVILPIGISFFTFQSLTYTLDVYRNIHAPLKKLSDYFLYILMFPQLIAGPIVRFNTIANDIEDRRDNETFDNKVAGFIRFSIGLSKKVLIANSLGMYANVVFNANPLAHGSIDIALAAFAYTFQIYFDFSGYSDMAIGLGRMVGFTFPENFNSPYISQNITEFWRRWHITLSTWMRDYLYIPMGGSRVKSSSRLYVNLITVFLISGLWHGASWNYIIWGAYHGMFLIIDRVFLIGITNKLPRIVRVIITFLITVFGWIIFRIEDLHRLKLFISQLFKPCNSIRIFENNNVNEYVIMMAVAIFFAFLTYSKKGLQLEQIVILNRLKGGRFYLVLALALLLFLISVSRITAGGFNPFIYFRF